MGLKLEEVYRRKRGYPTLRCFRALRQVAGHIQGRSEWEVFYACPSLTAVAFFEAVASFAPVQATTPLTPLAQLDDVAEAARATQVQPLLHC